MPYKKLEELPAGVKDNLPKRAQRLYMAAFNSAAEGKDATDEKSAAIAWSAVKAKYQKDDNGDWVKLQESAPRGSYEAERDTLYDALREDAVTLAKMKPTTAAATDLSSFPYIEFTFPDRIVVSCHDDKWSIPHTKTDGVVQFGEPTKVEIEATVVPDTSVQESKTRGQCGGTCRMTSDKPDLTETVTVNFGWDGCPPDVVHGPGDEPVTLPGSRTFEGPRLRLLAKRNQGISRLTSVRRNACLSESRVRILSARPRAPSGRGDGRIHHPHLVERRRQPTGWSTPRLERSPQRKVVGIRLVRPRSPSAPGTQHHGLSWSHGNRHVRRKSHENS